MIKNKQSLLKFGCILVFSMSNVYGATTSSASFNVLMTVTSTCSVSASDLTFSSITTGVSSNTDASSSITANCSNGLAYSIDLDTGLNVLSGQRRMRRAATSDYINYNIYSDSGRSTSWSSLTSQTGTGANQIVTIYGRVPGTQSITNAGNYSDQITVTISY